MPLFDNDEVFVGETLFDLNRGYGRVIQVTDTSMELDFTDRKVIYGLNGVQKGKNLRSLFWTQPYIIAPSKNAEHWVQTRMKFDAILSVLKNTY